MARRPVKHLSPWTKTAVIFLVIIFLVFPLSNVLGYEAVFRLVFRDQTSKDIPETADRKVLFPDGTGGELAGFFYGERTEKPHALVVFAHGLSSNHLDYAGFFRGLTQNGFTVFAFDAAGYGASGKGGSGGLPRYVRNVKAVFAYLETLDAYRGVPVIAAGHSVGAYAVGAALTEYQKADLAVLVAPFNASSDMLKMGAERYFGTLVNIMLPYAKLYEGIKFGDDAGKTAVDGILTSNVPSVLLFGALDDSIPAEYGQFLFEDFLAGSDRVRIEVFPDSGHAFGEDMREWLLRFLIQEMGEPVQEAS